MPPLKEFAIAHQRGYCYFIMHDIRLEPVHIMEEKLWFYLQWVLLHFKNLTKSVKDYYGVEESLTGL
jgi:hypothetical protein